VSSVYAVRKHKKSANAELRKNINTECHMLCAWNPQDLLTGKIGEWSENARCSFLPRINALDFSKKKIYKTWFYWSHVFNYSP
jgi:hypothetical protein